MSMRFEVSEVIDRPITTVFQFYAHNHVRNHPRWDPDIELKQVSDGSIGVGTIIRRCNSHSGTPVDGVMEVVEFEPNRAFGVLIHDGPVETRGRVTFDSITHDRTVITIIAEFPDMDESMDTSSFNKLIERSAHNIKHLIESES